MANPHKQAQLKAAQTKLRDEIADLVKLGKRLTAIGHYQKKCACSREVAERFIADIERDHTANFNARRVERLKGYR